MNSGYEVGPIKGHCRKFRDGLLEAYNLEDVVFLFIFVSTLAGFVLFV